jgi:hypothetical protein
MIILAVAAVVFAAGFWFGILATIREHDDNDR